MKRIISLLLISSIMGSVLHGDELARVPVLINHYQYHKISRPGITFITFLYDHYILQQKAESENDKKSDSQLPFRSAQSLRAHFTPVTIENKPVRVVSISAVTIFIPFKETKISTGFFDIWQPPKVG